MKNLSIKAIIDFRAKSNRAKITFAKNLKNNVERKETESGGDYWISSLSVISNTYKNNNVLLISKKIHELEERYKNTEYERTKIMYGRNIDILSQYEVLDLKKWKPHYKLNFIKKSKSDLVITLKGFQIKATPHHVFTFSNNNTKEIGAIWFVAKLNGFRISEVGMFTDTLYRYLTKNFSKDFMVNPKYCIAVDVVNNLDVNYSQIQNGEVTPILEKTINELKKII